MSIPFGLRRGRQQGFALLTVLVIVALVSIISAQMLYSQQSHIQRSGFMMHQAQALAVEWGLESWVKQGLKLDAENNKTDHLQELWAQPLPPVSFAQGQIGGNLQDAQGKINLNNVLVKDEAQRLLWQAMINRFVQRQNIALQADLAQLVTDWVDADQEPLPQGAESETYQLLDPPYSAANQPMVSLEALANFPVFLELVWAQQALIKQGFSTLPRVTAININTAPANVLVALAEWMTPQMAEAWLAQRQETPAETVDTFMTFVEQQTGLTAEEIAKDLPKTMLSVKSEFFILQGNMDYGLAEEAIIYSLFYRDAQNEVHLVNRWFGFAE